MLPALLIGSLTTVLNLAIQVMVIVLIVRYLLGRVDRETHAPTIGTDIWVIGFVLTGLFAGHLLQFATWAVLFVWLGEFTDFNTAFYHSAVNFASLGYGDIVMSEKWRLLGALEATNGVLMLGLSAGGVLSVMNNIFSRHKGLQKARGKLSS
jgi:hypothetical protein